MVNTLKVTDGIALYLHFPFCRSRCRYCSFVSFPGREADIERYMAGLEAELLLRGAGERVGSIFLGGGTPSLIPLAHLDRLQSSICRIFDVDENAEISIEANPGTVDAAYLTGVRSMGFNRLSLGAQSFDDRVLLILGRIHNSAEIYDAFRFARAAGFTNINLDLIYGIPGQSIQVWKETLDHVVSLRPEHLSLYPLTLEDDTPMSKLIDEGRVSPLDSDLAAEQYEMAQDSLAREGYIQYEISNWSRPGYECRHNTVYWWCEPYLGAGVAAHSFFGNKRQSNTGDLDCYLEMFQSGGSYSPETDEVLTAETQLSDFLMMGLRMNCGILLAEIRDRFGVDFPNRYKREIEELVELDLIEIDGQAVRLTRRGRLLGNEVFWRFLP